MQELHEKGDEKMIYNPIIEEEIEEFRSKRFWQMKEPTYNQELLITESDAK